MKITPFLLISTLILGATQLRAADPVTFNNQVVRIFQQQCQSCHRPGNIAPFPLLSYSDAASHASAIRQQIVSKTMPPWKPVNAHGIFENELTLTDGEILTIVQWIDGGMPEGNASDFPEPMQFPREWTFTEPDTVVQPDDDYQLDPAGGEIYRCFSMPLNSTTNLNVRGYEVLPGNREIVHHVLLFIDKTGVSATLDATDPAPGYTCFGDPGFVPDGAIGGWVPGMRPELFPLGIGVTVPAGARIVMQVHYSPLGHISHQHESSGPPAPDLTRVGLLLSSTPLRQVEYVPIYNLLFLISPGATRYQVTASTVISNTVELTAITPHMHLLGREVRVEATFPDKTTRELVHIDDWDFEWQAEYTFKEPILLPAGTRVTMTAWYDNSTGNPRNLSNPPVFVHWGEKTTDEMCLTFLSVTAPGPRPMTQVPFTVADRGGLAVNGAVSTAATASGYARISPQNGNPTPEGIAIFGLRQNDVLVTETAVSAATLLKSGRIFAETNGPVRTGLAIANPNSEGVTLSFSFTDTTGKQISAGASSASLPAGGQITAFLNEDPFLGPSPFTGTFTFTASQPVSVVALRGTVNARSEFLLTTLPVTELPSAANSTSIVFPHFADGLGWTTQILLVNPTDTALSGSIRFLDPSGQPVLVALDGGASNSGSYSIPPRAAVRYQTSGTPATLSTGSVRLTPSANTVAPSGSLIFSLRNANVLVTEAGVPALPAATAYRLYAEVNTSENIVSGFAIANPSSESIAVNLELTALNGSSAARAAMTIPANGQVATLLNEVPGFESLRLPFKGVLRITSASPVSVVGLRGHYNERADFLITTTTPVPESTTSTTVEKFFADFVSGAGYTTQFILFSSASEPANGTLMFYSNKGLPMTLGVR